MAIATNGGHVSRALEFIENKDNMYFAIGGNEIWDTEEGTAPTPVAEDYKLNKYLGLKKVDNIYSVVTTTDTEDVISYRNQNWKRAYNTVTRTRYVATAGNNSITVLSTENLHINEKIRISSTYDYTIASISIDTNTITLNEQITVTIPENSIVVAGVLTDSIKHVYVDCSLEYNDFPTGSYSQIGLYTGVVPLASPHSTKSIPAKGIYDPSDIEYLGVLEVIDNRTPSSRNVDQKEKISLIIEF